MAYDVNGALQAGASEDQVLGYLRTQSPDYDVDGALKAGASRRQVIDYLASSAPPAAQPAPSQPDAIEQPKEGLLGGVWKGLTGVVQGASDLVNPTKVVENAAGLATGYAREKAAAQDAASKGRTSEQIGHTVAAYLPGAGPAAAQIAETAGGTDPQYDKYGNVIQPGQAPNLLGAAGEAIGTFAAPELPRAARFVGDVLKAAPKEPPPPAPPSGPSPDVALSRSGTIPGDLAPPPPPPPPPASPKPGAKLPGKVGRFLAKRIPGVGTALDLADMAQDVADMRRAGQAEPPPPSAAPPPTGWTNAPPPAPTAAPAPPKLTGPAARGTPLGLMPQAAPGPPPPVPPIEPAAAVAKPAPPPPAPATPAPLLEDSLYSTERPGPPAAPEAAAPAPAAPAAPPEPLTPFDTPEILAARQRARAIPETWKTLSPEQLAKRSARIQTAMLDMSNPEVAPGGTVARGKTAYLVMGPPAAGKSTIANPLAAETHSLLVDSDFAKQLQPEYGKGEGAMAVHVESSDIADAALKRAVAQGYNIVHPVVGRTLSKLQDMRTYLQKEGYDVHLALMDLPAEEAAQRAILRYQKTSRFVDPAYILNDVRDLPARNYDTLLKEGGYSSYGYFSNDVPQGQAPRFDAARSRNFAGLESLRSGGATERGVLAESRGGATAPPEPTAAATQQSPTLANTAPAEHPAETANRLAKAQRFATVLFRNGITADDARTIPNQYFTQAQFAADPKLSPGWPNLAEYLNEGLPSDKTVPLLLDQLAALERTQPAVARNPKALAIAQQLQQSLEGTSTPPAKHSPPPAPQEVTLETAAHGQAPPNAPPPPPRPAAAPGRRRGRATPAPPAVPAGPPVPPAAPGALGADTRINIPGEETAYDARYLVRDIADVQASHDPVTFQKNPRYQLQNDRNYTDPSNSERIIRQVKSFEPEIMLTSAPNPHGTPVIDSQGNALSGNSRTMTLQRVYQERPEAAAVYRQKLIERAAQFGLDPAAVAKMQQPILVREIPDSEWTKPGVTKQASITDFNKVATAPLTAAERATADARRLTPDLVDYLSGQIEATGPTATLADTLAGRRGGEIVNRLIKEGVFTGQERPQLMDSRSGAVTSMAKERIAKMLNGQFFRDSEQYERTPPEIRNKLERTVAPLMRVHGNPEWDLVPDMQEAVDLLEYARAHGIRNVQDATAQESMFGDAQQFSPRAIALAQAIQTQNPTTLGRMFRDYAAGSEESMFEQRTPDGVFERVFGGEPAELAPPRQATR